MKDSRMRVVFSSLGGAIETIIELNQSYLTLLRNKRGLLGSNSTLPSRIDIPYDQIHEVVFNAAGMQRVGNIELVCDSRQHNSMLYTMKWNGLLPRLEISNEDMVSTMNNPRCIIFNQDKERVRSEIYPAIAKAVNLYKFHPDINLSYREDESALTPSDSDQIKLRQLKDLYDAGVLTDQEYANKVSAIVNEL